MDKVELCPRCGNIRKEGKRLHATGPMTTQWIDLCCHEVIMTQCTTNNTAAAYFKTRLESGVGHLTMPICESGTPYDTVN
jgi:predicted nucleic-acid-binding Zn-ribbon protein